MSIKTNQPPLKAATGKTPDDSGSGNHWDINFDGVAHYGMLPDFFQDLRALGASKEGMGPLFLGAEAYIRMWEKAWKLRASRGGN